MSEKIKHDEELEPRDRRFGGLLLVGVGLLILLANVTRVELFGNLVLPGLGIIFLVWAFYTHRIGFAIPGCILTGLGVGVLITQRVPDLAGASSGGVIVLGLAAGFLGSTLITPFFNKKRTWWGLIPGGILGLVGLLLIIGGDALRWLELLGYLWPLILVVIGVNILFGPRFRHQ